MASKGWGACMKRNLVRFYNTINILAAVFLLVGAILLAVSGCEFSSASSGKAFGSWAGLALAVTAIGLRAVWGIGTHQARQRRKRQR